MQRQHKKIQVVSGLNVFRQIGNAESRANLVMTAREANDVLAMIFVECPALIQVSTSTTFGNSISISNHHEHSIR